MTADDASSGSGGGRRKIRKPPPGAALSRCGGPCSSSGARPSPSPLRPPDLRPLLLLRRAAPFLSSPAAGSVGPDPPSPARGRIRPAAAGSRRWSHHVPALPFFPAGRAHWGTATATNSSSGARRRRWRGIWLLRRRLLVVAVVAVCWWQQRAATGRAAAAGVRAAAGVWPGPIFLFTVHLFCCVLEASPCAMSTLPTHVCRVRVAVYCTRQNFCRVQYGLCRVPQAHGKLLDSGSDS